MSDQQRNAGNQGTQPDSGSAPNDSVNINAAGGEPGNSGTQPDNTQGVVGNEGRIPKDNKWADEQREKDKKLD